MQSQQNNIKKRISPNLAAVIGALVLMLGGFFLSYSYIQTKKIKTYDMMAHYIYKEENNEAVIETEEKEEKKEETKPDTSNNIEGIEE